MLCKQKKKSPNALAKEIGAGTSACTYWKNGVIPKGETLIKVAAFFDCSVDFLLGRTDNPQSHKYGCPVTLGNISNSNGIAIGNSNSPVTINGAEAALTPQQKTLLNMFDSLDTMAQSKLLVYADSLKAEKL